MQNVSEGEHKTWLREKKCYKSDLFQILILTQIHFGPLRYWQILKVNTQGFLEYVKILVAQSKINSELLFEKNCGKIEVREKTKQEWGRKQIFRVS